MGLGPRLSSGGISFSFRNCSDNSQIIKGNPNPYKFNILKSYCSDTYSAAKIKYEGCTNYEGVKILVLEMDSKELYSLSSLDPHFFPESKLKARFKPDSQGWKSAVYMVNKLSDING